MVAEEFQSKIRFLDKGPCKDTHAHTHHFPPSPFSILYPPLLLPLSLSDEGKYINIAPVAGDFPSSFINASFVDVSHDTPFL